MLDNVRDRGMQKWRGLMLSEHLAEINNWMDKDCYEERLYPNPPSIIKDG